MKKKVLDFNSYVDQIIESKDIKRGTEQFDRIKKNVLSFEELYQNRLSEGADDQDDEEKIPKNPKKRVEYFVLKAFDKDPSEVRKTAARREKLTPWRGIMDWMSGLGEPTKIPGRLSGTYEPITDSAWLKKFKDRETTMEVDDIVRCMELWNGIFNENSKSSLSAGLKKLEKLTDPKFIDKIEKRWKNADYYPDGKAIGKYYFPNKFKIFGKDFTLAGKDMIFDKDLILKNSKVLLDKYKEVMDKTGKSPRIKLDVSFNKSETEYTTSDSDSLCLLPKTEFNQSLSVEDKAKLISSDRVELSNKMFSTDATASFFIWYSIVTDTELFDALIKKLEDPTYVKTNYVKITNKDKIDIINGIMEAAINKFEKGKKNPSISAELGIYGASSIMWWPVKAKETMPEIKVIKEATEGDEYEYENEYTYAWPYTEGATGSTGAAGGTGGTGGTGAVDVNGVGLTGSTNPGEKMAYAYFESDRAVLKKDKATAIDEAVKKIMDLIKSKNGTLLSFDYAVVASTSDEPSRFQADGTLGTKWDKKNNENLVIARAKVIEDELRKAITKYGIDQELVTKEPDILKANNTLGGTAVYDEKKWMRLDSKSGRATQETEKEYRKLFAEPKHSGILFNIKYKTIEKGGTPPSDEVTEVTEYEVVGEWLYQITWPGYKPKKRRRRRSSYRKAYEIPWGKLFPDIPEAGWGVKTLCCAYGNC